MTVECLLKYQQEVESGTDQNIAACRCAGDKRQGVAVTAFVRFSEPCPSNLAIHIFGLNGMPAINFCILRNAEFSSAFLDLTRILVQ
jgi:hypothetical protein